MSTKEPRGLGKGLSALLGEVPDADVLRKPVGYINKEIAGTKPSGGNSDVMRIPLEMIEPNPFQPRASFNQDAIDELAASIKSLGLIQPITVRRISDNRFQIVSGERRFRACTIAGMSTVPAYIRETDDVGMLELAIVENIQREDLDPIEIAMSYQRLIDECSMTQDEMAGRLGKKRASVANYLRLLRLPDKAQHDIKTGQISVGHAKVILGVDDPACQEQLCDLIIRSGLTVRQLEQKVADLKAGRPVRVVSTVKLPLSENMKMLNERLGHFVSGAPVMHKGRKGGGVIKLKFSSDNEIAEFLEMMDSGKK